MVSGMTYRFEDNDTKANYCCFFRFLLTLLDAPKKCSVLLERSIEALIVMR